MLQSSHLKMLKNKHSNLEKAIHNELKRPYPNDNVLHVLKREKLHIKEEIYRLSACA